MTDRELPRKREDYPYALKLKCDDPSLLLPSFQPVVGKIFWRLQELGYKPVIFDTLRTKEEALANAAKGTGSKLSMHIFGAACDLVCADHSWFCKASKCHFYDALRQLALKHAYIGPENDYPHFQALPISQQNLFRGLKPADRDAFIRPWLSKRATAL